jgi:hypothetical protein
MDKTITGIRSFLGRSHAIDCLFLLLMNRGKWGEAKSFAKELNIKFSYRSFKTRMTELEALGLAEGIWIDAIKKDYMKTKSGEKVACLLLDFFTSKSAVPER